MKYINVTLLLLITLLISCNLQEKDNNILNKNHKTTIAISKAHGSNGYLQYKKWLLNLDSSLILYDLYDLPIDSALLIMKKADALLITGGPDVNPRLYAYDSMAFACETPDNYRDTLETKLIKYAYKKQLPILGICRGQQIINVTFGGTLITDIPSQHKSKIIHRVDGGKCLHSIYIKQNSFLHSLFSKDSTIVNSAHHQAVKDLGNNLHAFAFSKDSIIESIGFDKGFYPNFFLGVQFHPEYLIGTEISKDIGVNFISSARNNK